MQVSPSYAVVDPVFLPAAVARKKVPLSEPVFTAFYSSLSFRHFVLLAAAAYE
jgi:hypothetical protein